MPLSATRVPLLKFEDGEVRNPENEEGNFWSHQGKKRYKFKFGDSDCACKLGKRCRAAISVVTIVITIIAVISLIFYSIASKQSNSNYDVSSLSIESDGPNNLEQSGHSESAHESSSPLAAHHPGNDFADMKTSVGATSKKPHVFRPTESSFKRKPEKGNRKGHPRSNFAHVTKGTDATPSKPRLKRPTKSSLKKKPEKVGNGIIRQPGNKLDSVTESAKVDDTSNKEFVPIQSSSKQKPEKEHGKGNEDVTSRQPHIVFIVADDWGWNDVGWHNKDIESPILDNLAKNGVILDNYYTYPTCTPSRAAILTGYYSHRLGLHHRVIEEYQTKHVPTSVPMMSDVLREKGYSTHLVGKWHLGHCNWSYTPTHRGFDTFLGYRFSSEDYVNHEYRGLYEMWENETPNFAVRNIYSSELFAARANNLTQDHAKRFGNTKPMYMYLAFQNIHGGAHHDPPKQYHVGFKVKVEPRRVITNSIKAMDAAVGSVVETLKRNGMYENTILVFASDNGGEVSNGGNNMPFRGGKFTTWEGGTRVPAFIHSPYLKNPGRVYSGLFHVVDWFPTLLRAASVGKGSGGPIPAGLDGKDMWTIVRDGGRKHPRDSFMYEFDPGRTAAIRVGNYKLIVGNPMDHTYAWITKQNGPAPHGDANCWIDPNDWFRTQPKCDPNLPNTMLFNIKDDPEERYNLALTMPDIVESLNKKLEEEKSRAVALQGEESHKDFAKKFIQDKVLYPGWC